MSLSTVTVLSSGRQTASKKQSRTQITRPSSAQHKAVGRTVARFV
jgi:hypothetical protein